MFPKRKRKEDRSVLESFYDKPCIVCRSTPSDPDHILTKGAGADDSEESIWPLCRFHHTEKHRIGLSEFVRRHPGLEPILLKRGFYYEQSESCRRWKKSQSVR